MVLDVSGALKQIKRLQGKLRGESFDIARTILEEQSLLGLEDDQLKKLLSIITDDITVKNATVKPWKQLLWCAVPKECITNEAIGIALLWLVSTYDNAPPAKINAMLEWITGLLEFNLADKKIVDSYYELYYGFLEVTALQRQGCKLIYVLTRPEDVFRGRVVRMRSFHLQSGKSKHTATLLWLFKTFKPELVPEVVPTFSIDVAFKETPKEIKSGFQLAEERITDGNHQERQQHNRLQWYNNPRKKRKQDADLIPDVMYVHLGSDLYREKKKKVIEFLDKESLACFQHKIEMPSCIMSLLLNEGGIHLLSIQMPQVHGRFSYVLYHRLHSVLIWGKENVSYEEKERLLQQIVLLQDYMQQGIPVVSRFLALYITSWNGQDHRQHIFKLLERLTFSSFKEFDDCILTHLRTLFLAGSIEAKCAIIRSLKGLLTNVIIFRSYLNGKTLRMRKFLGEQCKWEEDIDTIIQKLTTVVTDFCQLGLRLSSSDGLLLHTSLCFYETLFELEEKHDLEITVIPPAVFYRCMFSADMYGLSRVCGLILKYKNSNNLVRIGSTKGHQNVKCLNEYSCDLWNCLISKKAFSKSGQGYILKHHTKIKQHLPLDNATFGIGNHVTALAFGLQMKAMDLCDNAMPPEQDLLDYFHAFFEDFTSLMEVLNKVHKQYH